jgi:hypothetical protein
MITLDPLGHHFSVSGDELLDWVSFWTIRNEAVKTLPPSPETLFPLTANVKYLDIEKAKQQDLQNHRDNRYMFSSYEYESFGSRSAAATGAQVLARTSLASRLKSLDGQFAMKEKLRAGNAGAMVIDAIEEDDDGDDDE